ncbi:hypothetical protein SDC9_189495 [bioreactor metagenome]|uniref:Uncharacterized protein n=1 Tax=bioreactor metagenome TaxID=1076179 RepID=A0A645HSW4_9ZZZZ
MKTKKLELKKSVIVSLNEKALGQVKGGILTPETYGCGKTSLVKNGCGSKLCEDNPHE